MKGKLDAVYLFCDGASSKTGIGGYGYTIVTKKYKGILGKYYGNKRDTTNNEMELLAFIRGYKRIYKIFPEYQRIIVYSDSEYVVKNFNENLNDWRNNDWEKKSGGPVLNLELWKKIWKLKNSKKRKVKKLELRWVKAHQKKDSKDWKKKFNDLADFLAVCGKELLQEPLGRKIPDTEFTFEAHLMNVYNKYVSTYRNVSFRLEDLRKILKGVINAGVMENVIDHKRRKENVK